MTSRRTRARSAFGILVAGMVAVVLAVPGYAYPRPGKIERISVGEDGSQGNFDALRPAITPDGRFVAFDSISTTLVPGDNNARSDVFVRDRETGSLEIASLTASGNLGDHTSWKGSISADGRFVAFESRASNLVPGISLDNCSEGIMGAIKRPCWDIFVRDRVAGSTERVSVASDGTESNHDSESPSISADGRYVVFTSRASNLVPGDLNGRRDVFVHDRETGVTERVSVSDGGIEGNADSSNDQFAISADSRYVAFRSQANTLVVGVPEFSHQIYRKDRVTGAIELISVSNDGAPGNQDSFSPSISADGRVVAFDSFADNLVPNHRNLRGDVFIRDVARERTHRISVTNSGQAANDASENGVVSPDGRFVSFSSWATNLSDEKDGRWPDVFVHDRVTGEVQQASLSRENRSLPLGASSGVMSADSAVVAFQSAATGYVPGDTNDRRDIFTRERGPTVGIVDGPHATLMPERIKVEGSAVFSGVVFSAADDPADDGQLAAQQSGPSSWGPRSRTGPRPRTSDSRCAPTG